MLVKELKKISPSLASFIEYSSPELSETEVEVTTPKGIQRSKRFQGKCYMFAYKTPVGRATLPYYHLFPMVFMLEQKNKTMLGLNPFYLDPEKREKLINIITDNMYGDEEDPDSRASVTYKILNKYRSSYRYAFPCIKQYRHELMGKIVLEMKPSLWKDFYLGSIARKHETLFKGSSVRKIWSDSIDIARIEGSKKPK